MEIIWKYMYLHQKGKNAKLQTELKNRNEEIREVRRDYKRYKRKNTELKRALADMTEGYVTEYCECCGSQQSFFWDRETMGSVAHCPECGHILRLCSSCDGDCDYNYFTHTCKGTLILQEVVNEYH